LDLEGKGKGKGAAAASTRDHPHAIIAQRIWEAASKGDAASLIDLLSPDIIWRSYGSGELSGVIQGPEEVLDLMARTGELVDTMVLRVVDIFASDRGAVIQYAMEANQGPKTLESQIILLLQIQEGLVTEIMTVPTQAKEAAEFWRLQ
jgi:ketosteroid isomerase-like protein